MNRAAQKIGNRLRRATAFVVEHLEQRRLLNAAVVPPTAVSFDGSGPLAPQPGKTFWLNAGSSKNVWQWNSAITPVTTNDLLLNVTAFAQTYVPCCEADNDLGGIGTTGSINAGRLLTNGLTQNQIGGFPSGTAPIAATGSGGISDSSSPMNVLSADADQWWLEYNLGNYGNFNGANFVRGSTPNSTGYDITEIDVITGDAYYPVPQADVQVQFVNGNTTDWFSLSNGAGFSFTADQNNTPITRGAAQMAIVNAGTGSDIASFVRAVRFVGSYDVRELVVTGTPSAGLFTSPIAPNATVSQDAGPPSGVVDVSYNIPLQPSTDTQDSTTYSVQRASVINGVPGAFTTIDGSAVYGQSGTITFQDRTAGAGNNTYVYRVLATDPSGYAFGPISSPIVTPPMAVEMHAYNEAFWTGPVAYSQGLAQASISSESGSWGPGIEDSQDSVVLTGKVTTNGAGVYTFVSNTDDDGYLYVDGALVSDDPGIHGPRNAGMNLDINNIPIGTANPISLAANTSYEFVLLEHNSEGSAAANMLWIPPGSSAPVLVPPQNLSPVPDPPAQPTNLAITCVNSNFVNFTFNVDNSGVVDYVLQRQDVSPGMVNQPWQTVGKTWPAGNTVGTTNNQYSYYTITSVSLAHVTIQDAMPVSGESYIYRVEALNYDGSIPSPQTPPMIVTSADAAGLAAGTYFVAYTWLGDNVNAAGETQIGTLGGGSTETSIVIATTADIEVSNFGPTPPDAQNVNVYVGTASSGEKLIGTVSPSATLTIHTLATPTTVSIPPSNTSGRLSTDTTPVVIPAVQSTLVPGVEIHMYNGRLTDGQPATQYQLAMDGVPAEYKPQTLNETIGTFLAGVIDVDYDAQTIAGPYPPIYPSPAPTTFPDIPRVTQEDFSQIFTGKLQVGIPGAYTIISNTDDSGFVWVNGTLVSGDPGIHSQEDTTSARPGDTLTPVVLQPGQSYNLTMQMSQFGGDAAAHLKWIEPRIVDNQTVSSAAGLFNGSASESTVTLNMSSVPSFSLVGYSLYVTSGTGSGQNAVIISWSPSNRVADIVVTDNGSNLMWTTLPDTTSSYAIALYEPIPLAGSDNTNSNTAGGLSLRQDAPVQSTWDPTTGVVSATASGSAAQNVAVTDIDPANGVTLTWADQSTSELWFEVQRSTDGTNWTTVGTTPFDIGTSFTDPAAANAFNSTTINYFYRVRGVNFDGAGPFSAVVTTASLPPPPQLDTINGTAASDQITLLLDNDHAHIDWSLGGPVSQLLINDPAGLTINGNGGTDVITLDYSNGIPLPNTLHLNGNFIINGLQGPNPLANTTLEIGRSTVYISYSTIDPLLLIQAYMRNGYNGGLWNGIPTAGTGVITSLPAAQNAMQTTAIGYADSADGLIAGQPVNTIELKYTLYGDTTLSATVGFNDFTRLTQHYNQTTGGAWDAGDFNYDGSVNFADFTLMTRTYNTNLAGQAAPAASSGKPVAPSPKPQGHHYKKHPRKSRGHGHH